MRDVLQDRVAQSAGKGPVGEGTAPGVALAFGEGYPVLRTVARQLQATGIAFHDLSDALDGRPAGTEVYLDFCHINHEGNRRIARRLMDEVLQPLLAH